MCLLFCVALADDYEWPESLMAPEFSVISERVVPTGLAWSPHGDSLIVTFVEFKDWTWAAAALWELSLEEQAWYTLYQTRQHPEYLPAFPFFVSGRTVGFCEFTRTDPYGFRVVSIERSGSDPRSFLPFRLDGWACTYAETKGVSDLAYALRSNELMLATHAEGHACLLVNYDFSTETVRLRALMSQWGHGISFAWDGDDTLWVCGPFCNAQGKWTWRLRRASFGSSQKGRWLIVSDNVLYFPRLSPDHRCLAWLSCQASRADGWKLRISDTDLQHARVVTQDVLMTEGYGCPYAWSPSGDHIAYLSSHGIRVIDIPPLDSSDN